jgi:hypothetical protein
VLFYATDDAQAAATAVRLISAAGFDPVQAGGVRDVARIEDKRDELRRREEDVLAREREVVAQGQQFAVQSIARSATEVLEQLARGLEQATFDQRRQLVELLIDRVVVTDDAVETRYVIPTTEASTHTRFCQLRTDYFQHLPPAECGYPPEGMTPRTTRSSCWLSELARNCTALHPLGHGWILFEQAQAGNARGRLNLTTFTGNLGYCRLQASSASLGKLGAVPPRLDSGDQRFEGKCAMRPMEWVVGFVCARLRRGV